MSTDIQRDETGPDGGVGGHDVTCQRFMMHIVPALFDISILSAVHCMVDKSLGMNNLLMFRFRYSVTLPGNVSEILWKKVCFYVKFILYFYIPLFIFHKQ